MGMSLESTQRQNAGENHQQKESAPVFRLPGGVPPYGQIRDPPFSGVRKFICTIHFLVFVIMHVINPAVTLSPGHGHYDVVTAQHIFECPKGEGILYFSICWRPGARE